MKRFVFFLLAITIPVFGSAQRISIIPKPVKVLEKEGEFIITSSTRIVLTDKAADYKKVADYLVESVSKIASFELRKTSKLGEESIVFKTNNNLREEEYNLDITNNQITILSSSPKGAFYAIQTLFQLLPVEFYSKETQNGLKLSIPCCTVQDYPRFSYRGMHLDVCLHFFDVDYIKRYIDLLALHKMNIFHWHLTEDQGWRIEIKQYPKLTEIGSVRKETVIGTLKSGIYDGIPYGGYYSQEQIKEVVQYASDRFVTIIPEIEMPGHALAAITCYPELSCQLEEKYELATRWGVFKQVYCPKDGTFTFLENVLTEVMELFPSKIIHIGGDECPKSSWKSCPSCQAKIKELGLKDEFELQSYFIQRIEKFVNSKGRIIIGWDEILQGGLAPNAYVMSWLGEEGGIKAAKQHHNVVMCPHTKYYLDYYQADPDYEPLAMGHLVPLKEVYNYNPIPEILTPEEQGYIMGVQGCVWTEYLPTPQRVEYMAFPRAIAISETGWTSENNRGWNDFSCRLEHHLKRLDHLDVGYCRAFFDVSIKAHPDSKYSKVITMNVDAPECTIHYTIDGTTPTQNSPIYKIPFVINRSQIVKAAAFRNGKQIGTITQKKFE